MGSPTFDFRHAGVSFSAVPAQHFSCRTLSDRNHGWKDPLERVAALAESQRLPLATPEIGGELHLGALRTKVRWWKGLK